jgi:hypothetical protein
MNDFYFVVYLLCRPFMYRSPLGAAPGKALSALKNRTHWCVFVAVSVSNKDK